jgi:peptidoglycan/xylan/chitin deacetylase (PgdA/CDA1 family)
MVRHAALAARLKRLIKPLVFSVLSSRPVLTKRIRGIAAAELLTIINLHRVAEPDGSAYEPLHPRVFEELLRFLSAHFRITTFAELGHIEDRKPPLILSFDDGYKDFIEVAVPILEKHRIRVNHNVIPECMETGTPPLNVLTQDFIGKAPDKLLREFDIPGFPARLGHLDRVSFGHLASSFIKNQTMEAQRQLAGPLLQQFHRFDHFQPTRMMSAADVREIAGAHEIGAHSFSHANMGNESDAFFAEDLRACRRYFADTLGMDCDVYAFPNGSARRGQPELAQSAGFRSVLLVGDAFSSPRNSIHQRLAVYGTSSGEVLFRTLGGFRPYGAASRS